MYKLYLNRNESVKEYLAIPNHGDNDEQARESHVLIPAWAGRYGEGRAASATWYARSQDWGPASNGT